MLEELVLPDGLLTIGISAFENSRTITNVTIPSSVVSIEAGAFMDCSNLMECTCLAEVPPSINVLAFAFSGSGLVAANFYVPFSSLSAYKQAPYWSNFASQIFAIP